MAKFKINDKVRLKKDIPMRNYNGIRLSPLIKRNIDASSFVSIIQSDNDNTVKVRTTQGDYWVGEDALELYQKPSIYKVGDKVRIKERIGNENDYPCLFSDVMTHWSGGTFKIKEKYHLTVKNIKDGEKSKFYNGDDDLFLLNGTNNNIWHSSMFEPVLEDSKQKIQTLTSLKVGDLVQICGMIGTIRYYCDYSTYYLGFDNSSKNQEHFICCAKLRELVPNFDKIADEYSPTQHKSGRFPEFSTIDDLMKFTQAVNNIYNSKKSITTLKTLNENEIRFQKPKTSSIRGSVPTGRAICGRRCKTAIELGHLSNKACHF